LESFRFFVRVSSWIAFFQSSEIKQGMTDLILKDEVYQIVGGAMDVYYTLGSGFLEPVYQQALEIELARRKIPFEARKRLRIEYKGHTLDKEYVADFVCYDQIIIELKACEGPQRTRCGTAHQLFESDAYASRSFDQFFQPPKVRMETLCDLSPLWTRG
jgi:GxxExxY protein